MYLRVVHGYPKPGKMSEIAQHWEALVVPRLRVLPGFRHAYLATDPEGTTMLNLTMWDQVPDDETLSMATQAFRQQVQDLIAGPPTHAVYERLVEA